MRSFKFKYIQTPLLFTVILFTACGKEHRMEPSAEKFTLLRNNMVESQIISRGVKEPLVIKAMRTVPRHRFIPKDKLHMLTSMNLGRLVKAKP